jgi:hypothetical protein
MDADVPSFPIPADLDRLSNISQEGSSCPDPSCREFLCPKWRFEHHSLFA